MSTTSAHELVTEDVACLHGGYEAVHQMQIGTADRGRRHAHDRVAGLMIAVRDALDGDIVGPLPAHSFHRRPPTGCPFVVGISPVSINCLNLRRSS